MKVSMWLMTFLFLVSSSPFLLAQDDDNFGKVSYYSDSFQGKKTASGDLYDKDKLTAAHKTLPFGTVVKVTRLDNKRSVEVRVNDRGPFIKGRIIELSRRAAEQVGLIQDGVANVKIEVVGRRAAEPQEPVVSAPRPSIPENRPESYDNSNDRIATNNNTSNNNPPASTSSTPSRSTTNTETNNTQTRGESNTTTSTSAKSPDRSASLNRTPAKSNAIQDATLVRKDYKTYDLYKINLLRPKKMGFGVQVASFTNYDNAFQKIADLQSKWFDEILMSVEPGPLNNPVYKIILGQFKDMAAAENYKKNLKRKHKIDGFVIDLSSLE